jgi:hypothetical protein
MARESSPTVPSSELVERRSVPRLRASYGRARVVWREGPSRYCKSRVRLFDISEKGARILCEPIPRTSGVVWVGLASLPLEWVKASIRAVRPEGDRSIYHLGFCEPCPPGLIEKATLRPEPELHLTWELE